MTIVLVLIVFIVMSLLIVELGRSQGKQSYETCIQNNLTYVKDNQTWCNMTLLSQFETLEYLKLNVTYLGEGE